MNKQFTDGFIAPVQYLDINEGSFDKVFLADCAQYYPAYMYHAYIKRSAFNHEHEVRLLIYQPTAEDRGDGTYFQLDNIDFIEEITIDPRTSESEESEVRERLKKYNYNIIRSHLYDRPKFTIESISHIADQAMLKNGAQPTAARRWR